MKVIINGFHEKTFFPLILEMLNTFGVDYGHLTYTEPGAKVPPKMKATFHDVRDLTIGNYNVDWNEITPLDQDLIEKMNDCEVVVLKMIDRLFYEIPLSYDDRKKLYLKHLRYWNHILEKNKIDLFLSSNVPHEIYDFVMYSLCKLKKIPTILFFQTRISDTVIAMDDWKDNVIDIQNKYKELLEKYQHEDESKIELSGRFKRDFDLNTAKESPMRFEMLRSGRLSRDIVNKLISLLLALKFRRFLTLIRRPSLLTKSIIAHIDYFSKIADYVPKIVSERGLFKKMSTLYKSNTVAPDLSKKYIYFPLHMQPEASTCPLAGAYVEQVLIAQMIAYYLPENVYIYVKENPYQTAVGRDVEFYKELLNIPQVRFVPISFDTYTLTDNCLAVATATGTAGLEALYKCKPVLMFGYNFYQYARGVFRISSKEDCQQALNEILMNNFKPSIKDIKIFLKALEENSIEGYVDVDYAKDTHVAENISNDNILGKLIDKINSVCYPQEN